MWNGKFFIFIFIFQLFSIILFGSDPLLDRAYKSREDFIHYRARVVRFYRNYDWKNPNTNYHLKQAIDFLTMTFDLSLEEDQSPPLLSDMVKPEDEQFNTYSIENFKYLYDGLVLLSESDFLYSEEKEIKEAFGKIIFDIPDLIEAIFLTHFHKYEDAKAINASFFKPQRYLNVAYNLIVKETLNIVERADRSLIVVIDRINVNLKIILEKNNEKIKKK